MSLQAVLMCGGLGTRLRPWSLIVPKPMFPIGEDRTILDLLIERLRMNGISEIYISLGYKAELIEATFRDGSEYGVKIHYVRESEPLGTAGALNLLREHLTAPFLMMNGDLVTHLNFKKFYMFHQQKDAEITIGTKRYDIPVPYGVIEDSNGEVTQLREKPTYSPKINTGIYLINPSIFDLLPESGRFDATQLIDAAMSANRRVFSYMINEYWMDIGRFEDYTRANEDFKRWMDESGEGSKP
jgi:NDP-sugar pyrophosphorylase family protein